jgi:hypothetical protein
MDRQVWRGYIQEAKDQYWAVAPQKKKKKSWLHYGRV